MSKVWLVTGSSRGLGLEIAKAVLAAGDRLVATARNPRDLHALVDRYGDARASNAGRVCAVMLDVTQPAQARAAVEAARTAFGRLDVVVNNAGYANVNSIEDAAEDDFRAQIETNFFGVVNVTRAALPLLRAQRSGHIIQISSIGGRAATQGIAAYQSAKWAVGGFSEVLAREVAPLGIRVTVMEPGGMRTDWSGSSMPSSLITKPPWAPSLHSYGAARTPRKAIRPRWRVSFSPLSTSRLPRCGSCSAATPSSWRIFSRRPARGKTPPGGP
jgi:NAD(P)-dependent dehydrogenase (short-subunit alcohol dehydrogenase family)